MIIDVELINQHTNKYRIIDDDITIEVWPVIHENKLDIDPAKPRSNYAGIIRLAVKSPNDCHVHAQDLELTAMVEGMEAFARTSPQGVHYPDMVEGQSTCKFEVLEYAPHEYTIPSGGKIIIHTNVFEIRKWTGVDDKVTRLEESYQVLPFVLSYIQRRS